MTEWTDQRDQATAAFSRPFAELARRKFCATKRRELKAVSLEQRTQRQAIETLRRKYMALRATYLRITGTTYQAWTELGPHEEWEECLAAIKDEAVWDRLVERGLAGEIETGKLDPPARRRGGKR